jgi:hypothetical protein
MRLESGRIVDLDQMYREAKGKCCVSVLDVSTARQAHGGKGKHIRRGGRH